MMQRWVERSVAGVLLMLCLWGCGPKVVPLQPLDSVSRDFADRLLARYKEHAQPRAVDADIHLRWSAWTKSGNVDGTLQLAPPASLRLTLLDPLGRPVMILVADGQNFTATDIGSATVYHGRTGSKTWSRYVPESLKPQGMIPLLGGHLRTRELEYVGVGRTAEKGEIWYRFKERGAEVEHRLLLDREEALLRRYLLLDRSGVAAVEVVYENYLSLAQGPYRWPQRMTVSGDQVKGTVSLEVQHVHGVDVLASGVFSPPPSPPHFDVVELP